MTIQQFFRRTVRQTMKSDIKFPLMMMGLGIATVAVPIGLLLLLFWVLMGGVMMIKPAVDDYVMGKEDRKKWESQLEKWCVK